ncbi:MAG: hypothetical protein HY763_05820 [Planctomycetes bacterium]|nr:hypothetical protein [Planctomycetota bacterium]
MRPLSSVNAFFARLVLYYGVFLALWYWAGVGGAYVAGFQRAGTDLFRGLAKMGSRWVVLLLPPEASDSRFDTQMTCLNTTTRAMGQQPLNAQYHGYAPTSLLLTLVLASPVSWRRRLWAAAAGVILVHLWIALGLILMALKGYCTPGPLAHYSVAPWMFRAVAFITETVTVSTATRYGVTVFFWALVTFRRGDWALIARPALRVAQGRPASPSRPVRGKRRANDEPGAMP